MANLFQSAYEITDQVLTENITDEPTPGLPSKAQLAQNANRRRQRLRPKDPATLDFDLEEDAAPEGFFCHDIKTKNSHHLMFANDKMIDILSRAKNWFVDGTFKIVRQPFAQLLSIHAFIKCDKSLEQIPLMFVVMSGKHKKDYKRVFKEIKEMIPSCAVETVTIDFEAAMWFAIPSVFPDITILGCCFHWTQAVWRKVQELGLQVLYSNDDKTHKFIRKLLSLPYLPAEHINAVFTALQRKATTPPLQQLTNYISTTWINSSVWPIPSWSVFGRYTQTNNDVEGWHFRMNAKAKKGQLSFYMLIQLLYEESQSVNVQIRLVKENKLSRQEQSKYRKAQQAIFDIWDDYIIGNKSANQLLKSCSKHVYAPSSDK